jgi:hypothetical protein
MKMDKDKHNDRQIRDALKRSFSPVNTELGRDLWPDFLRRLGAHSVSVPWYDWVLGGLSAAAFLVFPRLVLVFAYHL